MVLKFLHLVLKRCGKLFVKMCGNPVLSANFNWSYTFKNLHFSPPMSGVCVTMTKCSSY